MENWKLLRIKDLGEVITGNTPPTTKREYYGSEYKFIKPTDMTEGQRYVATTEEYYSSVAYEKYKKSLLPPNTPCVVTIGSLGKKMCLTDTECFTNQAVNAVIPNKNNNGIFLYYAFKASVLSYVKQLDSGTSSGRENVSKSSFSNIKVNIPPLQIQQKIANILSRYDEAIENNNKRIKLLEQMAQNLYKEWFVRFRFPGWQNAEFENGIPKGWKVKQLKDFGRIETGKTPSMEDEENYGNDFLFIKTPDLHKSMFVFDTEEKLSEKGHKSQISKFLPKNSIMVSCIGTAGIVSINMKEGHTNQQINSIILNDITELEWLFYTCKSLKETIELFGAIGATMTNLSKGKFEKLKLIYPEKDILTKYHRITNPIFDEIQRLLIINQNLAKQRDLLLPRLMSGKLEVR